MDLRGAEALGLQVLDLAPEAEEFQLLAKLRQEGRENQDPRKIAALFLEGAQKLTLASRGSIFLFDQEKLELVCVAHSENNSEASVAAAVKMGEGVMSYVLQSGRPLLVPDVSLEPRFYQHQRSKQYQTRSFIVVPITGDKQWGLINLTDRCDLKPFTPRELFLGWLVARLLAETFQQREWLAKNQDMEQALQKTIGELRELKECYAKLTATLPLGIAILDRNYRVTSFNNAFAAYCCREVNESGAGIFSYLKGLNEADREKLQQGLARVTTGEKMVDCGQITLARPGVGNKFYQVQMINLPALTSSAFIMLVLEDLTEKSQLQQRLDLYEHLAIMGKLSACVIHELNNPLDGVKRYVSLAMLKKDDPAAVDRYLGEAQKGLQKMSLAINSILNVANPNRILKSQDTLYNHLREAVKILLLQAKEHRVEVRLSLPPRFEELAFGSDLYTVFINLIKNAIQAMPHGGCLDITGLDLGERLEIHFTDSGVGIKPEDLPNIFKPFFSTKDQGQGLGLGLTICQKIVQRYQGRLEVNSTYGEGTEFIVHLPLPPRKG